MSYPAIPGYWMNETSGVLAPVVRSYLAGHELDEAELTTMRAYLRQWVGGAFAGAELLRASVDRITTTDELRRWLAEALDAGIDPL